MPCMPHWSDVTLHRRHACFGVCALSSICAHCLLADAGPSGAGKSTLLNALACRLDKGATMEGKVRLNGGTYGLAHLKTIARCGCLCLTAMDPISRCSVNLLFGSWKCIPLHCVGAMQLRDAGRPAQCTSHGGGDFALHCKSA